MHVLQQHIHKAGHQLIQDTHAADNHQVDDDGPQNTLFDILYAMIRQGVFPLYILPEQVTSPPFRW